MNPCKPSRRHPLAEAARRPSCAHDRRGALVLIALATVVLILPCVWAVGSSPAAAPPWTVVMKELDNPRGLAFGDDGALYVAEAGRGGSGPCISLRGLPPCAPAAPGP
jgi:hypothetical protein